ncbi:MAG: galactose-1-phosphate uridylyltransferase [Pseudomonadota bacterium]|nr:galactose-1-phosphate uridylyltransferase [Pseudomonadota bacterium]
MHVLDMTKPDGRALWLYGREPVVCTEPAPSPQASRADAGSHMRWQPLRGEWIAYAPHRQSRTFMPPPEYNPLRPTTDPRHPTELPRGTYDVAVFDNLFPSLSPASGEAPELLVPTRPGTGHCEVVVYSQDERSSLGSLPLDHLDLLLQVWARHTELNGARDGIEYVLPFENRGKEVGVTLAHPHGQIYSYPFVPPVPRRMLECERAHYEETGQPLLQQLLNREIDASERILYLGPHAVALVPVCARYSYEVWVAPRRAVPYLYGLPAEVRIDLARALKTILMKFDALWQRPFPYVMAWFQAPTDGRPHPESHLHVEFYPPYRTQHKLKYLAGTELAAGLFASDSLPEQTAQELRSIAVDIEA